MAPPFGQRNCGGLTREIAPFENRFSGRNSLRGPKTVLAGLKTKRRDKNHFNPLNWLTHFNEFQFELNYDDPIATRETSSCRFPS